MRFRRDGIQKVTGDKVFAINIRARDMKGWPEAQSHALILRAARTDAVFDGVTLEPLGALAPDVLVSDDELERDGVQMVEADFYGRLLLKKGERATCLGQPLAILIWHDYGRFRAAKARLRFNQDAVVYGTAVTTPQRAPYGAARFVRIGGERPEAPDVFSPLKDALVFADLSSGEEQWPIGDAQGDAGGRALYYAQALRDQLASPPAQWRVWKRSFHSQSVDPAALEPDNGNAWFDAADGTLHVVTGTQSPFTTAQHIAQMAKAGSLGFNDLKFYPGYTVGYGQPRRCNRSTTSRKAIWPGGSRGCLARGDSGLDARLRHAAIHGHDRNAGRRDRR